MEMETRAVESWFKESITEVLSNVFRSSSSFSLTHAFPLMHLDTITHRLRTF